MKASIAMKTLARPAFAVFGFAFAVLLMAGCASTKARETQLDLAPKTAALEPQDVRRTVEMMVDSMLADRDFITDIGGKRPVLDITRMENRSSMHLDMNSITDSIRTKLLKSRKFRFMDRTTATSDIEFFNEQANSGLTDPAKAVQGGKQSAAQMYLYGALTEMRQQINGVTDRYFKFTLNLKDLESGELIWSDEKEIRKEETQAVFGF